jgi:Tol biopolymer transport system component
MKIAKLVLVALLSTVPILSVEAAEVVFAGNRDGQFDLFKADLKTSEIKQLTETAADETMPAVSSDGASIAFVSNRGGADSLYRLNLVGNASEVEDISAGMGAYAYPAYAQDGSKIAVRYAPDPQSVMLDTQIVLLDPKTRQQQVLIDSKKLKTSENSETTVVVDRPVWVSENLIAYLIAEYSDPEAGRLTKSTIYMYDLKKQEQVRVAGGESYFNADGSPMGFRAAMPTVVSGVDGRRLLVFTAIRGGTDREPMKIAISGGEKGSIGLDDPDFFGPLMFVDDLWVYGFMDEESNTGLAWRAVDLKTPRNLLQFNGRIITPAVLR